MTDRIISNPVVARPGRSSAIAPIDGRVRLAHWLALALVVAAVTAALLPVCRHEFTTWDDAMTLRDNPTMNPVTWNSVRQWWTRPYMDLYVPVTWSSWGIISLLTRTPATAEHAAFLNPVPFHTANLVVHVLASLVVFQILRLLTGTTWPSAIGAMLFGLHPVQVEAVAWTSGLKDVLGGLLALLAIWQYLSAAQRSRSAPGENRWRYAAATLLYVLAMLAKPAESAAVLVVLVLDVLVLRRSWRSAGQWLWPWFALAAACGMETFLFQPVSASGYNVTILLRPIVALNSITFYVGTLMWPAHLTLDYGQTPMRMAHDPWLVLKCLFLVAATALFWRIRRKARLISAGAAVFVVALSPILGLVTFDFQRYSNVADHYLYLPMLGAAIIAAELCRRWARWPVFVGAGVVLAGLGVLANGQAAVWSDTQALFAHALDINPSSWVACNALAMCAFQRGDNAAAIRYGQRAIAERPDDAYAYVISGQALWKEDHKQEAYDAYVKALEIEPDNIVALDNLAVALVELGRLTDATSLLRRAIAHAPKSANSHLDLGLVFRAEGKFPEAVEEMQNAVVLNPYSAHDRAVLQKTRTRLETHQDE